MITKNKFGYALFFLLLGLTIVITILKNPRGPGIDDSGTSSFMPPPSLSLNVFKIDSGIWAFEVFIDSNRFIYQDKIPGMKDSLPITSQADAIKFGESILKKIKGGKIPSIFAEEADSMEVVSKFPQAIH